MAVDEQIEKLDSMIDELEKMISDTYKLDFTGMTDSEKSEAIKSAVRHKEWLVNQVLINR